LFTQDHRQRQSCFGNLVPFGKLWRTGANENTTVSLVMMLSLMENIEERKVRFVYYSKYSELGSDFYTATDNWGTPAEFNEANVALRTTVKEEALPKSVDTH
jgi:low affinity Fe/Cu permease